jgi:hypothetical protein
MDWKQHETGQTAYRTSQTTTNNGYSLRALRAATPSAPPLHGDALVAIEKLKREKNNEGREKDFKRNRKFDICVGKVQDNCD